MRLIDPMIGEFGKEAATTRRFLERVPEADHGWKPHEKSMSMGALASHIAELLQWMSEIFERDEYNIEPSSYRPWLARDRAELLERFDAHREKALATMKEVPDAKLMEPWSLKMAGKTVFTMPRAAVLRAFVFSHLIHHRGQLSVYLRLRDVAVPSAYGPSADESGP